MSTKLVEKRHLSAKVREKFKTVPEPIVGRQGDREISIEDCCMSALAMFKLKFSSVLQFDIHKNKEPIKTNLKNLYSGVGKSCDQTLFGDLVGLGGEATAGIGVVDGVAVGVGVEVEAEGDGLRGQD